MGGNRGRAIEKSGNFIKFKVVNGNVKLSAKGYVQNECTWETALLILHLPKKDSSATASSSYSSSTSDPRSCVVIV